VRNKASSAGTVLVFGLIGSDLAGSGSVKAFIGASVPV
jgi:hypothetical protein